MWILDKYIYYFSTCSTRPFRAFIQFLFVSFLLIPGIVDFRQTICNNKICLSLIDNDIPSRAIIISTECQLSTNKKKEKRKKRIELHVH